MKTFLLFHSNQENSYAFFEEDDQSNRKLLEEDARMIWSVEARTWEIACMRKNEYLGWEPYRPLIASEEDLRRFIPADKHDLENAQLIENIGYPGVQPIVAELLELMQDFNWPVAKQIAPFLIKIAPRISDELAAVLATDDSAWKYWILSEIIFHVPVDQRGSITPHLRKVRDVTEEDKEWEIERTVREILEQGA